MDFPGKIYVKNDDGKIYEAYQINENNYAFRADDKLYKLSISESKQIDDFDSLSDNQKASLTKAIFENESILNQLRDAKKNRDKNFSYYSGDEKEFEKLVDEITNDG